MATPLSVLPGQKLRLRDILERHSLPTDLTVVEGFDGPTDAESISAGARIRIHFVAQDDVISAEKESDGREIRIPLNSSVFFEPLPTNPKLDDTRYRTARDVISADPQPGPVYATVALLLPDGLQIDEDDLIEFGETERDEYGSVFVRATRHYFNHVTQTKSVEQYRVPADLEANFTLTAPSNERYLPCELVCARALPMRARMHLRRKAARGGLRHVPELPVPLRLKRYAKRYYAIASELNKSQRVFALEVYDESPLRFLEGSPGRKSDEDPYYLLYGLVDFTAISKIGPPEADLSAYRDLFPLVKVPLNEKASSKLVSVNAGALNYQLIKAADYQRVGMFFQPHSSGRKYTSECEVGPRTMDLGETRFYDVVCDEANGGSSLKLRTLKMNLKLEGLCWRMSELAMRSQLSDASVLRLKQLEDIGKPAEAPAPPVPQRSPLQPRPPRVQRGESFNLPHQTAGKSKTAAAKSMMKKGLNFLLRRSSEEKSPTGSPSNSPSGSGQRRPIPPPPIPGGGSPLSPRSRLAPSSSGPPRPPPYKTFEGGGYVSMVRDTALKDELTRLENELRKEETRKTMLKASLEQKERSPSSSSSSSSSRIYDDKDPIECLAGFSRDEVLKLLRGCGLEKYEDAFREFDVEGYWLVECDMEALRDIGMREIHAVRFHIAISKGEFPQRKTLTQVMS